MDGLIIPETKRHLGAYADVWQGKWCRPGHPTISVSAGILLVTKDDFIHHPQVAIKYLRFVKMSTQVSKDPQATADRLDKVRTGSRQPEEQESADPSHP